MRKSGLLLKLPAQPFQVLQALLERSGEVVTRDELRQQLWRDDTYVNYELAVKKAIHRIREVLGDCAQSPRFIETVPKHGYRFIVDVCVNDAERGKPLIHRDGAEPSLLKRASQARQMRRWLWATSASVAIAAAAILIQLVHYEPVASVIDRQLTYNSQGSAGAWCDYFF